MFLDGSGGTGKTYLYEYLLAVQRSEGHIALAVASSGKQINKSIVNTHTKQIIKPLENIYIFCNDFKKNKALQRYYYPVDVQHIQDSRSLYNSRKLQHVL